MLYTLFLFLAGVGIVLFITGCYSRRISLLSSSIVFNLANFMSPWVVVYQTGESTDSVTGLTTYTFDYLDYTTKLVLSSLFLALAIISILQSWNVISIGVVEEVRRGREVDRL